MSTIDIMTTPVAGQRIHKSKFGLHILRLFKVDHVLRFDLKDVEIVELESGKERLLLRAKSAAAFVFDTHFDFYSDGGVRTWTEQCVLSGAAVISRVSNKKYRVEIGVLRVQCQPKTPATHLDSLWPVKTPIGASWNYLWTPYGLGIETALVLDGNSRKQALLLPALGSSENVAWNIDGSGLSIEQLKPYDKNEFNAMNSAVANVGRYTADDAPWPANAAVGSTARRWRVFQTTADAGLVDDAMRPLGTAHTSIDLETIDRHSFPQQAMLGEAAAVTDLAVVADLWAIFDYREGKHLDHRGVVIRPLRADVRATIRWNAAVQRSVLEPQQVHVACKCDASSGNLIRAHQTLESGATTKPRASLQLVIDFKPDPIPPDLQNVNLQLAAVAPSPGDTDNAAAQDLVPRWLAIHEGWLDLETSLYTDTTAPMALFNGILGGQRILRGDVPLDEIGGPAGLTALVPDAASVPDSAPYLRLRIGTKEASLGIDDAAFLWRTPAWWVQDEMTLLGDRKDRMAATTNPLALPDLSPAFEQRFSGLGDVGATGEARLRAALASRFRATVWVGHRTLAPTGSWQLATADRKTVLTTPELSISSRAWLRTPDAFVLSTLRHAGPNDSSVLLDCTRSLTPLRLKTPRRIGLKLAQGSLPSLAAPVITSIENPPAGAWEHVGGEQFLPHIPGLGYLPKSQSFEYRHGFQMAAQGYVSQGLGDGPEASSVPLASVRAHDDLAIRGATGSSFKLNDGTAKKDAKLKLSGWVPLKELAVTELKVQYVPLDKGKPSMTMSVAIGRDGDIAAAVNIDTLGSNFEKVPNLRSDDSRTDFWLEPVPSDGNFVGFGQPLLVSHECDGFADGTGRRWTPFKSGARIVVDDAAAQERLSFTAFGMLSCSPGVEGSTVGVALLDVAAGSGNEHSVWDLVGVDADGRATAPIVGPYPLFSGSLVSAGRETIVASFIIGQPFVQRDQALGDSTGDIEVAWTGHPGSPWSVASSSVGSFNWRIRSATWLLSEGEEEAVSGELSAIQLHRLEGRVKAVNGVLDLQVNAATVRTALGLLRFETAPAPLEVKVSGDDATTVELHLKSIPDPVGGFVADLYLRCERMEVETVEEVRWCLWCEAKSDQEGKPGQECKLSLGWMQEYSEPLTLKLLLDVEEAEINGLQSHSAALPIPKFRTGFNQSSEACFAFVHAIGGAGPAHAVAGSISVVPGRVPRLEWSVRESTRINAALLFGALVGHEVRGDIRATFVQGTRRIDSSSTITGYVELVNDVQYEIDTEQYTHRVRLVFDGIPLTSRGGLLPECFDAAANHRFLNRAGSERVCLRGVHRFNVSRLSETEPFVQCTALLLLAAAPSDADTSWSMQVRLCGDTPILMARTAQPLGVMTGNLVRLAVRNQGSPVVVQVPTGLDDIPLLGLPLEPVDGNEVDGVPSVDVWHERGALASAISPQGLARVAQHQTAASFESGDFPKDRSTLAEWRQPLTSAFRMFQAATLSAARGVLPSPFVVSLGDVATASAPMISSVPNRALRVELLGAERRSAAAALSSMASGLVHVPAEQESDALPQWAHQELRRQSTRAAAVLVVQGDPAKIRGIARSFQVSAVSDIESGAVLPDQVFAPAFSDCAQMASDEGGKGWQSRMVTFSHDHAVLEAVASRPFADEAETGRVTRLARAVVWQGSTAIGAGSDGVSLRQSVKFEVGLPPSRWRWPAFRVFPLVQKSDAEDLGWSAATPPLIDITEWALRPGDMLSSSFWSAAPTHPSFGPPVELSLRAARPTQVNAKTDLTIEASVDTHWDGVDWRLHRITIAVDVGVPRRLVDGDYQLSAITPRGTMQVANTLIDGKQPKLVLGMRPRALQVRADGRSVSGIVYNEPLLTGAFCFSDSPSDQPLELAIVRLNMTSSYTEGETEQVSQRLSAAEDQRKNLNDLRCLVLYRWPNGLNGTGDVSDSTAYDDSPARLLSQLLDITDIPDVKTSNTLGDKGLPWLLSSDTGGPALALVQEQADHNRVALALMRIIWLDLRALDMPSHIQVASGERIVGFGRAAGRGTIALSEDRFVYRQTSLALEDGVASDKSVTRAWRFGPSGASTGQAARP
jgi:hypothetical protein